VETGLRGRAGAGPTAGQEREDQAGQAGESIAGQAGQHGKKKRGWASADRGKREWAAERFGLKEFRYFQKPFFFLV
jgi:hypothetical protein